MSYKNTLQPALINTSHEYFKDDTTDLQLCNGVVNKLYTLPDDFTVLLAEKLSRDLTAQKSLDKIGITDQDERLKKYYHCNYSAFDHQADISASGQLGPPEYVTCMERGFCLVENKLCKNPCELSNREVQVANRIRLGQQDDQISMELFISKETLRNHKNNIEVKIGKKGKPAIAAWAERSLY